jgi:hypothetical protein
MKRFAYFTYYQNSIPVIGFLYCFLSFSVFAQAAKNTATPAGKDTPSKKEAEGKPLKMESGTVMVDPQSVSSTIKQSNLRHLKKLKSSFYNQGEEQKFQELMKAYVEASITLGEKNFLEARRKFEQNQSDMNEQSKGLLEKYKASFTKYYADYSYAVVDMKINGSASDLSNSSYEKMLATANEFRRNAEEQESRGNVIDGIYSMKQAINQLIRIPYFINKNKNKNLKINERVANGFLIDEDFIPKEAIKDYDDSLYLIHADREKDREKERENIKKGIQSRLGSDVPTKDSENPPAKAEVPAKKQ